MKLKSKVKKILIGAAIVIAIPVIINTLDSMTEETHQAINYCVNQGYSYEYCSNI